MVALIIGLFGCSPATTPDEACPKRVGGTSDLPGATQDTLMRIACYRRLAGLYAGKGDTKVDEAAVSHVDYLFVNEATESDIVAGKTLVEDPSQDGFTGETVIDRLHTHGYKFSEESTGVWEIDDLTLLQDAEWVDALFQHPTYRELFLQPAWKGAGFSQRAMSEGVDAWYTVINIVYKYPAGKHFIPYPVDGQVEVPPNFLSPGPGDFLWDYGVEEYEVGFPITITMSAPETELSLEETNSYGAFSVDSSLTGPDGSVEHVVIHPLGVSTLQNTIVYLPEMPLSENSVYTFEATVESKAGRKDVTVEFTTGTEVDWVAVWTGGEQSAEDEASR